ncbi:MAG: tetratricopeptide repeat protein, partial [Pseudomonadota bacterium]
FVGMLALLPALIMFAYNHGAPGRDKWTSTEKVFIPANLLLAGTLLYFISPMLHVEAATELVELPDETGETRLFEVARSGHHKDIMGFFWQNKSDNPDLDWLAYGLPLMIKHDVNRATPVVSIRTPFNSFLARRELAAKGHNSFLDEDIALQVEIARGIVSHSFLVGSYNETSAGKEITVELYDTRTRELIGRHSATGNDWLDLVDRVSEALLDYLDIRLTPMQSDDPVSQHFSASIEAIEHYTSAEVAVEINNDYTTGVAEMERAVTIDPEFAEADAHLAVMYFLNGDVQKAADVAKRASDNDYRMSQATKFKLRANSHSFGGKYRDAERVLELWARVEPQSTEAYAALARVAKLRGGDGGLAKASGAYEKLLELRPYDYGIYRQMAQVEQQRGDYTKAVHFMDEFLENEPANADAYVQLAGLHQAQGDLEKAESVLEDAAILSSNPLQSNVGLARLQARRGKYQEAQEKALNQFHEDMSPQDRMTVLLLQMEIALATGQIKKSSEYFDAADTAAKEFLPPMIRMLSIESPKISTMVMLGQYDEALARYDELAQRLQPPMNNYVNFGYTTLYFQQGNEEKFREWTEKTHQARDTLPELFETFVDFDQAQVAIYDERYDEALSLLQSAEGELEQSLLGFVQDSLMSAQIHSRLGELYYDAGAYDRAIDYVGAVLKMYPALAEGHLIQAKAYLALNEPEPAKVALEKALTIWENADPEYVKFAEATELQKTLL